MTNTGIFLLGTLVTFVVFVALGILAYGIALERRDLDAEKRAGETVVGTDSDVAIPTSSSGVTSPHALAEALSTAAEPAGART